MDAALSVIEAAPELACGSGPSPVCRPRDATDWIGSHYFSDLQKYLLIASCLCWNLHLVHNFPVTRVRLCDAQCQFVLVLGVYGPAELDGFVVAFTLIFVLATFRRKSKAV